MSQLHINPELPTGQELGRVLRTLATKAEELIERMPEDAQECVHELRTSMKKLRSGLFLGRSELPTQNTEEILAHVVFLKNTVGPFRDRHVQQECLLDVATSLARQHECPEILDWVKKYLLPERLPPLPAPDAELRDTLRERVKNLQGALQRAPFWVVTQRGVRERLHATHRKVLRWRERCRRGGDDEDFHEFRKAVKHQAAQCHFTTHLFPEAGRYLARAESLGTTLGQLNDLANLRRALDGSDAAELVQKIEHRISALKKRALQEARSLD